MSSAALATYEYGKPYHGFVAMWNEAKGYGFLACPGYENVFAHVSTMEGYKPGAKPPKAPVMNDGVEFVPIIGERGLRAKSMRMIEE